MGLITLLVSLLYLPGLYAQETATTKAEVQKPEKKETACDNAYEIANLIFKGRWSDVAQYLKFPIERDYPFKKADKNFFLKNPQLFFEKNMFGKAVAVKETPQGCMVNRGVIWTQKKAQGRKVISINYETMASQKARIAATKEFISLLPTNLQRDHKVTLNCQFKGRDYTVYKGKSKYLLQVSKNKTVTDSVPMGTFRRDESGIRYFKFREGKTVLTLADNIREGGYYLQLKASSGKESFFKCL